MTTTKFSFKFPGNCRRKIVMNYTAKHFSLFECNQFYMIDNDSDIDMERVAIDIAFCLINMMSWDPQKITYLSKEIFF